MAPARNASNIPVRAGCRACCGAAGLHMLQSPGAQHAEGTAAGLRAALGAPLLAPARRCCLGAPEGWCRAQGCSTRQAWKRLACRKTTSGARCAWEAGLVSALGTLVGVTLPPRHAGTLVECCSRRAGCQQEQGAGSAAPALRVLAQVLYLTKGEKYLVPVGAESVMSCLACASKGSRLAGGRGTRRSHPRNSRPNHHLGVVESRLTGLRACRDCSWDRHYPGDVGYLEGDAAPGARAPPTSSFLLLLIRPPLTWRCCLRVVLPRLPRVPCGQARAWLRPGLRLKGCGSYMCRQVRRTSGRGQYRHRGPGGQARRGPGRAEPAGAGACLFCCCLSGLLSLVRSRSRALPGSASVGRLSAAAERCETWTVLGSAQSVMPSIVMGSAATAFLWVAGASTGSQPARQSVQGVISPLANGWAPCY